MRGIGKGKALQQPALHTAHWHCALCTGTVRDTILPPACLLGRHSGIALMMLFAMHSRLQVALPAATARMASTCVASQPSRSSLLASYPSPAAPFCRVAVEAVLPMRAVAETLNDVRPEMRELRAVVLGPFLMAGGMAG